MQHYRKKGLAVLTVAAMLCVAAPMALAVPVTLSNMPAYDWYHGCTPTAIGMVIGYWDLHGYGNLFDASGADVYLTSNIQDHISSPAHNAKYDPTPDNTLLPHPPDTSIADFTHTSEDPHSYGGSSSNVKDDGILGYTALRGYSFNSWQEWWSDSEITFSDLVGEIDAGRPMVFGVDSSGNGGVDHSVAVLGYDMTAAGAPMYGMFTTWTEAETISWQPFRGVSSDYAWGIHNVAFAIPGQAPAVPVPGAFLLGMIGVGLVAAARKKST